MQPLITTNTTNFFIFSKIILRMNFHSYVFLSGYCWFYKIESCCNRQVSNTELSMIATKIFSGGICAYEEHQTI